MSSESERFLKLAIKVTSRVATLDEQRELDRLLAATPTLRDELWQLKKDLERDEDVAFTELLLRTLLKTASNQEIIQIRSLQQSNPKRWNEFLRFGAMLQVFGEGAQVHEKTGDSPEPMPDKVRKRLVSALEKTQKEI